MSEQGKLNLILAVNVLSLAGLVYAYFQVAPLLVSAQTTLDNTNALETKVNKLI